jgi:hypothetical protein
MKKWLAGFSARLEQAIHDLLWRQWTLLGVPGAITPHPSSSPLDPEALLLLTLESARTEPRLFDEVLEWLVKHGHRIDVQRLRNLVREDAGAPVRLVAAAGAIAGEGDASAKWKRLAAPPGKLPSKAEPLFLLPGNAWLADPPSYNALFAKYGYLHPGIKFRNHTGPLPMRVAAALRFRLRSLFGIGIRAEVLAHLIAGNSGPVRQIADSCGYSLLGTMHALRELAESESLQVQSRGRERIYWTDAIRWWEFLDIEPRTAPGRIVSTAKGMAYEDFEDRTSWDARGRTFRWPNGPLVTWTDWKSFFAGLALVLRFARRRDVEKASPYAGESELGQVLEKARGLLASAGSPFKPPKSDAASRDVAERLLQAIS